MDRLIAEYNRSRTEVFWGELAPGDHICQLYETEACFLDTLESYVIDGIKKQEAVVLICTPEHLQAMIRRLLNHGLAEDELKSKGLYHPHNAQETLDMFMRDSWPSDELFNTAVMSILNSAKSSAGSVRAFGEMVALLWAKGHHGATVALENLWQKLCQTDQITLFCAYPRSGFTQNSDAALKSICDCHNKMLSDVDHTQKGNKFYSYTDPKKFK